MSPRTPKEIAERYFEAWADGDFEALRAVLADDISYKGPLGQASDPEGCIESLRAMAGITDFLEIQAMIAEGEDVMTWFDLATTLDTSTPTVNWMRVRDGRIVRIRVAFDARELAKAMER